MLSEKCLEAGTPISAVCMRTELTVSEAERLCDEKIRPYVACFDV
jgi:hypothetical protein